MERRGCHVVPLLAPISGSVLAGSSDSVSGPGSTIASFRQVALFPSEGGRERRGREGREGERVRRGREGGRDRWGREGREGG